MNHYPRAWVVIFSQTPTVITNAAIEQYFDKEQVSSLELRKRQRMPLADVNVFGIADCIRLSATVICNMQLVFSRIKPNS